MAQNLTTNILINARSNGFTQIGDTLTALGSAIDGISEKLIGFGKDSLNVYEGFDKNMGALESVWGTNGTFAKGSRELNLAMAEIDKTAREWARDRPFHLDDISNAMVEAARTGWDMNDMLASMPAVMDMALAGNMDLSTALDYVLKSMRALRQDTKDPAAVLSWVDEWVYAANRSSATAAEFGDTFLRMGSTMKLAADPEEILALTAVMANFGTTGSAAGTLVRNSILRLLAPSQTGRQFLEQLGATDEELQSIREDSIKLEAFDELYARGFSVFDDNGQAKPILQVYSELGEALSEIAGGYENIIHNETTLGILSNIFGTRSATGALNIVQGLESAQQIYDDLKAGMAEGAGEYSSQIMMGTLWGQITQWESRVENLESRTGEVLADQLTPVMDAAGQIVNSIAELDTGTFNALVAGLEVLALAGPGLLLTGTAFRTIGYLLTPAGGLGLGLIALTAAANAIEELEEADFASKFGDLELDPAGVQNYVQQISEDFRIANENVTNFKTALSQTVEGYTTASATFKESLIRDMLTGAELTEGSEEYQKLYSLGETMIQAVKDGIRLSQGAAEESITNTFSVGTEGDQLSNPIWAQIITVMTEGFSEDIETAESLGQQLRDAMTAAFIDGALTPDEVAKIQAIMDQMNELLAQQQAKENFLERQRILRKAQTLGISSIRESAEEIEAARNTELETLLDQQAGDLWDTEQTYNQAIKQGLEIPEVIYENGQYITTGAMKTATDADKEMALAALREQQEYERSWYGADFNQFLMGLWTEGITSSDVSGAWSALDTLARSVRENGGAITGEAAIAFDASGVTPRETAQAYQYLGEMVESLGGRSELAKYADFYSRQNDEGMADQYRQLMTMYDIYKSSGTALPAIGQVYTPPSTAAGEVEAQIGVTGGAEAGSDAVSEAQGAIDGRGELTINVGTDLDSSAVDAWQPPVKYMDVYSRVGGAGTMTREKYAEGGRATNASIFGEDGPEWAIPEEHSERTAELLNAARAASGFTWPDILARFGGMNANASNTPATLVYSPTIYANDANDVDQKLLEDKARLEKWLAEKQMLDGAVMYA